MRIVITIEKKKYRGCYNWNDITLAKFVELVNIPIPESYRTYILADGKFDVDNMEKYIEATAAITEKQINNEFPEYYKKVIKCLTNIPDRLIQRLTPDHIAQLYEYYLKPFVITIIYHVPIVQHFNEIKEYEPPEIRAFRIGLNFYYLPETVTIMEQKIPLRNEPIISYRCFRNISHY